MFYFDMNKVKKYVGQVEKKLNSEKMTRYLQFGTKLPVAGQPMLRDAIGLQQTKSAILQSAENHYKLTEGRDEFARAYKNFSATAEGAVPGATEGYGQVSNVRTVGAMDLTIIAMAQSIIPFVALDRSMATPEVTIYYNDLVAMNGAGNVGKGDVVNGNFRVPNPNVELEGEVEVTVGEGSTTVEGKCPIIPGTVEVVVGNVTGRDFARDSLVYFPGNSGVTGEVKVTYSEGKIENLPEGATVRFKIDQHADNDNEDPNATTLKVTNQWTAIQLKSAPQNIILNDNLMNRMYMQNTQMIATAGAGGTSAADVLFARTKNTYIEFLNAKVLKEMIKGKSTKNYDYEVKKDENTGKWAATKGNDKADVFLDLSDYSVNNWAVTKNDLVGQVINNLRAKFLGKTNMGGTALVTGSYGVALLANIPNLWVPNPDQLSGMNGLAGYFSGLPVYRHSYIDNIEGAGAVDYFMVAKTPDNNCGSLVYGEFLPLTSTGVVSNFAQPANISNGFFAQVGVKKVVDSLVMKATIVTPANGLFDNIRY